MAGNAVHKRVKKPLISGSEQWRAGHSIISEIKERFSNQMKIKSKDRQTKQTGVIPPSLETRCQLCSTKAEGFRILKRVLKSAHLTEVEAVKVNHCLAAA